MKKITRKQIIFLIVYPIVHIALSVIFVMLILMVGGGFNLDGDTPPPTYLQQIIKAISTCAVYVLWAPIFILKDIFHIRLSTAGQLDYLWIGLTGVLYGFTGLFLYKLIRKR